MPVSEQTKIQRIFQRSVGLGIYSINGNVTEWFKVLVSKTSVGNTTAGSNPAISANFIKNDYIPYNLFHDWSFMGRYSIHQCQTKDADGFFYVRRLEYFTLAFDTSPGFCYYL